MCKKGFTRFRGDLESNEPRLPPPPLFCARPLSAGLQFSIWDWDPVGENDLVGVYYGKLRHIENAMKETKGRVTCRW